MEEDAQSEGNEPMCSVPATPSPLFHPIAHGEFVPPLVLDPSSYVQFSNAWGPAMGSGPSGLNPGEDAIHTCVSDSIGPQGLAGSVSPPSGQHHQGDQRPESPVPSPTRHGSVGGDAAQDVSPTTLMLRNIPNRYTREMLVDRLNQNFKGQFDFLYLPIDTRNTCNKGYCFINFRTLDVCERFKEQFHGIRVCRCLPGGHMSKKVAEVTLARVHGREENIARFRNSCATSDKTSDFRDHKDGLPVVFDDDGQEMPIFTD